RFAAASDSDVGRSAPSEHPRGAVEDSGALVRATRHKHPVALPPTCPFRTSRCAHPRALGRAVIRRGLWTMAIEAMGSLVRHWSGRAAPAWNCASVAHFIPGAESVGSRLGGGRDCRDCHLREAGAPTSLTRRVRALYRLGFAILMPPGDAVFVHRERAEHIARALIGGGDVLVLEDALA